MTNVLLFIALSLAAYLGFVLLALGQARHWRAASEAAAPGRIGKLALRIAGGVSLSLALCLALFRDGPSFGALLWTTVISVAALVVALTLSWRPRLLRPLAALVCLLRPDGTQEKEGNNR